jgi:hypothetical protein
MGSMRGWGLFVGGFAAGWLLASWATVFLAARKHSAVKAREVKS